MSPSLERAKAEMQDATQKRIDGEALIGLGWAVVIPFVVYCLGYGLLW